MKNEYLNLLNEIADENTIILDKLKKRKWGILKKIEGFNVEPLHFIFELLQNADDQNAKKAKFYFLNREIRFFHNGSTFKKKDVEAICAYSYEDHKDVDHQKIGKFGLGFKSIFQFTDIAKIYTQIEGLPLNFSLENRVVPKPIESLKDEIQDELKQFGKTCFLFDLKEKYQNALDDDLKKFIGKFSQKILLYLQHIEKVEFITEKTTISVSKKNIAAKIIEINLVNNLQSKKQRYFVYEFKVEDKLKNYGDKIPPVKIAYKINKNNFVRDQETTKLNVFLPTLEETGLYFDIHAPFILSPSREHISYSADNAEFNNALMDQVSEAIIQSFLELKKLNLINSSFLELMPIKYDPQPERFSIISESIDNCFKTEKIWPNLLKKYSFIEGVIQANHQTKKIFDIKDLREIFQSIDEVYYDSEDEHLLENSLSNTLEWITELDSRGIEFAKKLKLKNFENYKEKFLEEYFYRSKFRSILTFKSNDWLLNFYIWMYQNIHENTLRKLNIIKTSSFIEKHKKTGDKKRGKYFLRGDEVRFFSKETIKVQSFYFIDNFFSNLKGKNKKNIIEFFKICGVTEITEEDHITSILEENYSVSSKLKSMNVYIEHINRFIKFANKPNKYKIFKNYRILLDNSMELALERHLYLDSVFYKTNLSSFYEKKYKLFIPKKIKKNYISFSLKLGIQDKIYIKHRNFIFSSHPYEKKAREIQGGWYTANADYIDDDFFIDDQYFNNLNVEKSIAICLTLNKIPRNYFFAAYRKVQNNPITRFPSTLNLTLTEHEWIPDLDGNFKKPRDLTLDSINKEFYKWVTGTWLGILDFSQGKSKKDAIDKLSDQAGLNRELTEIAATLTANEQEDATEYIKQLKNKRKIYEEEDSSSDLSPKHGNPSIDPNAEKPVRNSFSKKNNIKEKNHKLNKNIKKKNERINLDNETLREMYANHCQICLTMNHVNELVPPKSYAEKSYHRKHLIEIHHVTPKSVGGTDDASNLLSLCRFHHREYGDDIESKSLLTSLINSNKKINPFLESKPHGIIVKVKLKDKNSYLEMYFDDLHKKEWLK